MSFASVGDTITREVSFPPGEIARFATEVGDSNPLHHDPDYAAATRFGGIIACAPQMLAHFYSAVASYYSTGTAMVGLGSSFTLHAPVYPDRQYDIRWTVTAVQDKQNTGGQVVDLEGTVAAPDGVVVISAEFKALVVEKL